MPRLIAALIRHGDYHQRPDTPSAHQPYPLNDSGRIQAAQAVQPIQSALQEFDCRLESTIDSSRLLRAWQTASIIAEGLGSGLQVREFDALAERCVGSAANLTMTEIDQIITDDPRYPALPQHWKSDSDFCLPLPGAESLRQAGQRVALHLRDTMMGIASNQTGNCMKLFVGHGAALRHAACELGALDEAEVSAVSMHHARPVFIEVHPDARWQLVSGQWKQRASISD